MTASVYLVEPELVTNVAAGDRLDIRGPEARHAVTVSRVDVGEAIDLVDGNGRRVRGVVAATALPDHLAVDVTEIIDVREPDPRFVVVQALAKGEHGELAIDLMTQLGVDEVIPWQANRSVVRWTPERAERAQAKWQEAAIRAAKQSRRSRVPRIAPMVGLDGLITLVRGAATPIVLHEEARWSFLDVPLPRRGDILLIVGPEGGIDDAERAALIEAGAREAVLGPMVLRSSLAGAAALAVLASRIRWASSDMEGSGA